VLIRWSCELTQEGALQDTAVQVSGLSFGVDLCEITTTFGNCHESTFPVRSVAVAAPPGFKLSCLDDAQTS
jgi:hypothetical protein